MFNADQPQDLHHGIQGVDYYLKSYKLGRTLGIGSFGKACI